MLKLPVCPYCQAEFLYSAVKHEMGQKNINCPHCKKTLKINKKYQYVLFLCALILLILVNWFFLTVPAMNLPFLIVITAIGVIVTYFLIPYTVRYKKP